MCYISVQSCCGSTKDGFSLNRAFFPERKSLVIDYGGTVNRVLLCISKRIATRGNIEIIASHLLNNFRKGGNLQIKSHAATQIFVKLTNRNFHSLHREI